MGGWSTVSNRFLSRIFVVAFAIAIASLQASATEPVIITIETDQDFYDTVFTGQPVNIIFHMKANGNAVASVTFPLVFSFTNGNIVGPVTYGIELIPSTPALEIFENIAFNDAYGGQATSPDTLLFAFMSFGGSVWTGSGELCRIKFVPSDTGSIMIDTGTIAGSHGGFFTVDTNANNLPWQANIYPIHIPPRPDSVRLDIVTSYGNDSLYLGGEGSIIFTLDGRGHEILVATLPLIYSFTNGNIMGRVVLDSNFIFSPATSVFENRSMNGYSNPSDPDTMSVGLMDFSYEEQGWETSGELFRIVCSPLDTGSLTIDSTPLPPLSQINIIDQDGAFLPFRWRAPTIHVGPCPVLMGDVNADDKVTSADLIYMVNYIFRGGAKPLPGRETGDVNCSETVNGVDIIHLVNYLFKGGNPPCGCYSRKL